MSSVLSDKHFHDERAAYAFVEARLWPNGPTCPHDNSRQYWRTLSLSPSASGGTQLCPTLFLCRRPDTFPTEQ